jgi:MSHA biogenesis protein MshO
MNPRQSSERFSRIGGVTLIELAIVIALIGILAALVVQFVTPVRSYIDSTRRAALADAADTALRRIGRDVHLALPNSVRVGGSNQYVEFMLVRTAGRYRLETDPGAASTCTGGYTEDVLKFGLATESCFKTIGNLYNPRADITTNVTTSDYVVVFNLQPNTPSADAYENGATTGGNKAKISAVSSVADGEDKIEFANNSFTFESPGRRFFIIEGPVTFGCDTTAKTLKRYSGYTGYEAGIQTPPAVSGAILATGVESCEFTYAPAAQGAGLLTLRLQLKTQDSRGTNETVNLYHAVHVNNVP